MQEDPLDRAPVHAGGIPVGKSMSRIVIAVSAAMLLLVVAGAVAFVWVMSSLPTVEGQLTVPGLEQPAKISRDVQGVPSISARSQRDAYFLLGFVHAQDRLWQMEMQRRVGAGRLAEVVGEHGLANDRFMRTLGLYRVAEASFERLDKPVRETLQAYAEGVNAWLSSHQHRLPPEFVALRHRPEPWRPADSLVFARVMALQLAGNWRQELTRAQAAATLPPKRMNQLWPAYPADAPATVSQATAESLMAAMPEQAAPRLASNIWAVAGRHTASGKPLLANDPHLGFQAPVLWYLAAVQAPGLTLAGATVPGVPFHLIGHNFRIAWGFTATNADTIDLFVEKLAGEGAYQTPKGPLPFKSRDEVIRVKDAPDQNLRVRETRHGPVVSDVLPTGAGSGEVVSFASAGLAEDDLTAQAFHRINRAGDWKGFVAALKDLHSPVQNAVYADTTGNIGFYMAGRVPVRRGGSGAVPARGWTGEADWLGWVPFPKLPQTFNPPSGLIVNANNKVVPDRYPHLITTDWPEGYRAQRILQLLERRRALTVENMAEMQLDMVSLEALEMKELLTGVEPGTEPARLAAKLVAEWDGRFSRERPEPLIYSAWVDRLNHAIFADELGDRLEAVVPVRPYPLMNALISHRHWCDDVRTPEPEGCDALIARSLDESVAVLAAAYGPDPASWTWGAAHAAEFSNPVLGKVPLLERFANLSIPTDGGDHTVNRGTFVAEASRFPHTHGAGLRVVYDLADLGSSRFVIATGQSGNPISRHYGDMLEAWRTNRGFPLGGDTHGAILSVEPAP